VAEESISLSASPDSGWRVDSWTGTDDDTSTASTNTVTMPASAHAASVNYTNAPGVATLISPAGDIGPSYNPTYTWYEADLAETYIMGLSGPGEFFNTRVVADSSDCVGGICSVSNVEPLVNGEYTWWIKASNPAYGDGEWSEQLVFTVSITTPVCHALTLSHTGNGSNPTASPTNSTDCSVGEYIAGENISLSGAAPDTSWEISGWTGTNDDASTAATNTVTMPTGTHTASVVYKAFIYLPIIFNNASTNSTSALTPPISE
jgi:hypothetical protein